MQGNQPKSITILHTNDIHSHFEKVSSIAAYIAEARETESGSPLLLVDIGDHMDRTAMETEGTMGGANVDILNLTGYDVITIGNNEGLTLTPEDLASAYSGLLAEVVCCNIIEKATGAPPAWMKKHTIIEKGDIRIGITGATAPFAAFYELLGLDALEPEAAIEQEISLLRPQVDIVVLLSHLGLATDQRLAERLQGLDLILGGHTHHLLEKPLQIENTTVCGAGKFGDYVGRVRMVQQPGGTYQVAEGGCIPVDTERFDENVSNALVTHRLHAEEALKETVAVTDRILSLDYTVESPFGNLLAQAVRRYTQTEIALVNTGQLLGPLPEGEISAGLLHTLCPSPINACVIKLKGRDIRLTLEQSLLSEFWSREIKGFGFRGEILGNIAIDGLEVLYDAGAIPYDRIVQITFMGEQLQDEQVYEVGTLDMFTFGIGYERIALGQSPEFLLPDFLRDLLRLELQRPGSLDESEQCRWAKVH
ncbi:bifunctional metallophosphatase/5'-nucleotidase [Paenibacillus sp. HJL G12]|uniref:Bifunctional metallophosphatase/5'-nucleotidase n=1 Tax=Paenibacillus dendrobii TaxID=2691084 RepID=A0A7X3IL45_9BACL|nr:bifunctional UDP-sugar hydrolase/5'-nucleotidase [Paenibacillus dendrobii]MWV44057.1 bifunctional metallophosphatase/5'-nucleotidase [Paenibacillus dendrobii]